MTFPKCTRQWPIFVGFLVGILLCGCSYRRVGSNGNVTTRSIYVAPVINRSRAAEIQGILWQQLVREINGTPSLSIASKSEADFVLQVTVDGLSQFVAATSSRDTGIASAYTVLLNASCTLEHRTTQQTVFKDEAVHASISVPTQPSFVEAKRQATPQLTNDLAIKIRNLVCGTHDL